MMLCICTHEAEWQGYQRLRKDGVKVNTNTSKHLVLYHGVEIVGAVYIILLTGERMKVVDIKVKGKQIYGYMIALLQSWARSKNMSLVNTA